MGRKKRLKTDFQQVSFTVQMKLESHLMVQIDGLKFEFIPEQATLHYVHRQQGDGGLIFWAVIIDDHQLGLFDC